MEQQQRSHHRPSPCFNHLAEPRLPAHLRLNTEQTLPEQTPGGGHSYAISHMLHNIFVGLPHRKWTGLKGPGHNKPRFRSVSSLVTSEVWEATLHTAAEAGA